MEDIIINAPVIIENIEFPDQSALIELLIELKGDCFFSLFIGKYS